MSLFQNAAQREFQQNQIMLKMEAEQEKAKLAKQKQQQTRRLRLENVKESVARKKQIKVRSLQSELGVSIYTFICVRSYVLHLA